MSQLTVKKVEALIKAGGEKTKRYGDGGGLYLVVPHSGYPSWMLRFTSNKKRREMTLGKVSDISLRDARLLAAEKMKQVREGFDPLIQRKRAEQEKIKTVSDLFEDWYPSLAKRLKHPNIPKRIFIKDIAPHIGDIPLNQVNARDVRNTINAITAAGKPTIANDALGYCKQLFNHGMKLDLMQGNPASAFTVRDAGGVEKSKDRTLTTEELKQFFYTAKQNPVSFTRDNYLACALLVCLGVRKSELCEAKWEEFDLEKAVWELPKERSKTNVGLTIPLAPPVFEWLEELKVRSFGSDYVFPSRRSSKNPHMGPDTLNRAITKLFGHEPGKKKQPPNLMGDMPHFTVHDLRRTCRTLLAQQGTPGHVAERCLNHKLKGVEGIYDRHDYFEERQEALDMLALHISKVVDF
ncbi:TPA: tyrosine-type recombinase/integrase [Vibrio parahaemolyticus]|nr:tyrosine-type recombinase/integrase [Vibrio parahaemolyticus]HCG6377538.1 tyrosine-type recombinase/integrase [Vibrio parahaemolyticus]HCG8741929.1 tyrosine-type recombinase/integrase [Vibrio parahaemolyticus]HCG9750630.1 tyrosine-type recombinase/integrase [Vibrio parahaemolyticus]HCH6459949.1 tyrosine-type recombinase/integrase [Vibrio parahaemolyticus]